MNYLKLTRPINLLLIALVQVLIKYSIFQPFNAITALSTFQFALLVIATVCIAAGGNVINDVYDAGIDRINRPNRVIVGRKISERNASTWYVILTAMGVGIGFLLANAIGRPMYSTLFIGVAALLYLYATYIKTLLLMGTVLVSVLVAMSMVIVGVFDIIPVTNPANQLTQWTVFKLVLQYAVFAFMLNFLRELIKDLQDINGDKNGGKNTLPIAIGRKRATSVAFVLGILITLSVIFYMYEFLYDHTPAVLYFLFLIVAPLLFFCIKAFEAEKPKHYALLSTLLKIVMVTGMCSMVLYPFVIL
ncbi:geranylgeranylglycerol-phosphate geranylgeranyltransferase [Marixanthomonas spongiae]|uniref:Prenyltransferase n=1 Tax=Marixanthomonas spongiae TaxID=2174845 RepID=A0A2U0HYJ1_9FLAO|nr:geranylgeranylglycerol-phosphate geranylgeranyltransferase [Marixanthomonas spongiae]PVW13889.1 prenyltransferase [Marixanthomonas spongiae]